MDFDSNCLKQIMTNLISNAIKFTNSGGEINVSIKTIKDLEKDILQIEIRDTSIGITAEKIPHIFDRFYQVDGSTTIKSYRLKKAKILLETQDFNVSEVAWKTGFSSLLHFPRVFQEEFNTPPSEILAKSQTTQYNP